MTFIDDGTTFFDDSTDTLWPKFLTAPWDTGQGTKADATSRRPSPLLVMLSRDHVQHIVQLPYALSQLFCAMKAILLWALVNTHHHGFKTAEGGWLKGKQQLLHHEFQIKLTMADLNWRQQRLNWIDSRHWLRDGKNNYLQKLQPSWLIRIWQVLACAKSCFTLRQLLEGQLSLPHSAACLSKDMVRLICAALSLCCSAVNLTWVSLIPRTFLCRTKDRYQYQQVINFTDLKTCREEDTNTLWQLKSTTMWDSAITVSNIWEECCGVASTKACRDPFNTVLEGRMYCCYLLVITRVGWSSHQVFYLFEKCIRAYILSHASGQDEESTQGLTWCKLAPEFQVAWKR